MNSLKNVLKELAINVKKVIDEGLSNGKIQPDTEVYFRWKVDKFKYTDKGITESSARGESISRPTWFRTSSELHESLRKSNVYASALEQVTAVFPKSDKITRGLESFLTKLIHNRLNESKFDEAGTDNLINILIKELNEEPVKYGAEIELKGIVLQPERIDVVSGVTIRQPKIEDIEKETPGSILISHFLPQPSAILNIEFLGRHANEIQKKVEQAIAILRLFRVGGVSYESYHMYSDSIIDLMASGSVSFTNTFTALETYLVNIEDEAKLKNFWQKMTDSLPKSFFDKGITKTDYTTIAYNRYCDALLHNGILERRISNAVMGLEALFFKPDGEMQELAYRLRIRISKLLGLFGYDPHEAKEKIDDAYGIRSTFLHGGHLDYKKTKKLELKYKDSKTLLLSILDYLRISIIVNILIPKEKDEFIDLIDDSLIDRKKEEQLISLLSWTKEFVE